MSYRIYVNGIYRDMTREEEAEYLEQTESSDEEASVDDYEQSLADLGVRFGD